MSKPKWKELHEHLLNTGNTVAVEHLGDGKSGYFLARGNTPLNARTVRKLIEDELLRPVSEFAGVVQQYEAAA